MTKARTLADNYAADINQVSAGVGITGGGTSGTVTITNDMATSINAKGDLVVGTANDTYSRLAVASTAGYVLTVDSAEATGLKWAAAATSSGPAFGATLSADQTITINTYTKVQFNTETFDTDSCYDATTNYRFTPNKAGYYLIGLALGMIQNSGFMYATIYKNGSMDSVVYMTETDAGMHHSRLVYFNGSTDYVEAYARLNGGGQLKIFTGSGSYFYGQFVRS